MSFVKICTDIHELNGTMPQYVSYAITNEHTKHFFYTTATYVQSNVGQLYVTTLELTSRFCPGFAL